MPDSSIIAAIQLNAGDSIPDNLETSFQQLSAAKDKGAVCAVLPENFAWMGAEHEPASVAEHEGDGPVQQFLSQTAQQLGLWIIGGTHKLIVEGDPQNRVTNTTLVYDPSGRCAKRYDKIHLFDADVGEKTPYLESDQYQAGERLSLVDLGFARIGLSICYDLRFPAMFQAYRQQGADVIVVPAAFTVPTGRAHWQSLLRARAIENQVYIIAPAQCGIHSNGRKTWGHSVCIDPWGEITSQLENLPGNIVCKIDSKLLREIRGKMPVIKHQRPAHYKI